MILFKNQIFANLNGHAIIGVKYFLSRLAKLAPKPSRHETHLDPFYPSVRSRGFEERCLSDRKWIEKRVETKLDSEKVKIKRESGI